MGNTTLLIASAASAGEGTFNIYISYGLIALIIILMYKVIRDGLDTRREIKKNKEE